MDIDDALDAIRAELDRARSLEPKPLNSPHEAHSVIEEEYDEFWDAVRLNPRKNPERLEKCKEEAIHLAATALRFLVELC